MQLRLCVPSPAVIQEESHRTPAAPVLLQHLQDSTRTFGATCTTYKGIVEETDLLNK